MIRTGIAFAHACSPTAATMLMRVPCKGAGMRWCRPGLRCQQACVPAAEAAGPRRCSCRAPALRADRRRACVDSALVRKRGGRAYKLAACSSTNRVCTRRRRRRAFAAVRVKKECWSRRRRCEIRTTPARLLRAAAARSPSREVHDRLWPAANRIWCWCDSRHSRSHRRERPAPTPARTASACRRPGRAVPSAFMVSRLTRAWMATPRGGAMANCRSPSFASDAPAASCSWMRTRSSPVIGLGDRVFDLQARIGFDKGEGHALAALLLIDQKFNRAQAAIVHRFAQRHGQFQELRAHVGGQAKARARSR